MFTKKEKEEIFQKVSEVEEKCGAEIVPMVLKRSDIYPASHFRLSMILAFSFSFGLYYFPYYQVEDPIFYIWASIAGIILGHTLCYFPKIKRFFILNSEMNEEVHQRAIEAFFNQNIHSTKSRNGILIFISELERRAEVIVDCGINEKVDKDTWNIILNEMLTEIKIGNKKEALLNAIDKCGSIVSKNFPIITEKENELENSLIEKND